MLDRLEHETRDHHAEADADLFRALDDTTRAGYHRFLATVYRFEYAVESQLVYVPDLPMHFIATRLRTGLLGDDLVALGRDQTAMQLMARPVDVPRISGALEAIGWIYVLQRNTLQHAALYRALAPRSRPALQLASRYLTAFAANVYQRWHELGAQLARLATAPERAQQIIEVAHDAFARQHRWYGDTGSRRSLAVSWTRERA